MYSKATSFSGLAKMEIEPTNGYDYNTHCHICGYYLPDADEKKHYAYCHDFQKLENRFDRRNVLHMGDILNNEALYEEHRKNDKNTNWSRYATYYVRAQFARSILDQMKIHDAEYIITTHLPFWKFRKEYLKSDEAKEFFGKELVKEIRKEYWGY